MDRLIRGDGIFRGCLIEGGIYKEISLIFIVFVVLIMSWVNLFIFFYINNNLDGRKDGLCRLNIKGKLNYLLLIKSFYKELRELTSSRTILACSINF